MVQFTKYCIIEKKIITRVQYFALGYVYIVATRQRYNN